MTDFFLQIALSNACFSLALAIVAMVVGAKARRPHLAWFLWLLVFVKLLTPPVKTIPIVTIPWQSETPVAINDHSQPGSPIAKGRQLNLDGQSGAFLSARIQAVVLEHGKTVLSLIWLMGSVFVLTWSLLRVYRFNRLLKLESEVSSQELQAVGAKLANRFGLKAAPAIYVTSANLSPMVWWIGGKVRIIIPTALLDQMETRQFQWILAHELAHVRRRDYLIRWIEWLACVCFWWNPVTWWARHNLRANEEICCDALVVSRLNPKPESYANSLLTAIEYLVSPALRPPAIASEINSGGFLERRFEMIVKGKLNRNNSRWLQACVLLWAVLVLPFGVAFAQDYKAVGRRLRAAVEAGELTGEQARIMLGTLRKAGGVKKDTDINAIGRRIRAAVQAGKLTKEEAREKMAAIKKGADKKEIDYEAIGKKIKAAVQAGKLTEEEAEAKWIAIKKGAKKKDIDIDAIGRKIRAAVAAGKITAEEGRAKMAAIRKEAGGDKKDEGAGRARAYLRNVRKKLGAAVEAGKISEEDAKKEYQAAEKALKERMAAGRGERGERGITVEEYKRAEAKMRKMIEEGKAKPEDVKRRLIEMRKIMGAQGERKRQARDIDWESIKKRIEGAVKRGDITRKEADAKYKAIKERMAGSGRGTKRRNPRAVYQAAEKEIKAAIAAGKITKEQGKARLEGLKKRLAQGSRGGRARGERNRDR